MERDTLGNELGNVRESRGQSLRAVSRAAEMSPTYLQRLERDEIRTPSPKKLLALSRALNIPYDRLMLLAGYAEPEGAGRATEQAPTHGPIARALLAEDLTEDEADALAEYLAFRRSRRR